MTIPGFSSPRNSEFTVTESVHGTVTAVSSKAIVPIVDKGATFPKSWEFPSSTWIPSDVTGYPSSEGWYAVHATDGSSGRLFNIFTGTTVELGLLVGAVPSTYRTYSAVNGYYQIRHLDSDKYWTMYYNPLTLAQKTVIDQFYVKLYLNEYKSFELYKSTPIQSGSKTYTDLVGGTIFSDINWIDWETFVVDSSFGSRDLMLCDDDGNNISLESLVLEGGNIYVKNYKLDTSTSIAAIDSPSTSIQFYKSGRGTWTKATSSGGTKCSQAYVPGNIVSQQGAAVMTFIVNGAGTITYKHKDTLGSGIYFGVYVDGDCNGPYWFQGIGMEISDTTTTAFETATINVRGEGPHVVSFACYNKSGSEGNAIIIADVTWTPST